MWHMQHGRVCMQENASGPLDTLSPLWWQCTRVSTLQPRPLATVRTGPRMQSGVFFLYTLPSQQESERCCDGFSRDPPVAVRAWRAVYPYEGHQHTAMVALLVVRFDVKVRRGGAERLHASCRHVAAVAEVESGELSHVAHC